MAVTGKTIRNEKIGSRPLISKQKYWRACTIKIINKN